MFLSQAHSFQSQARLAITLSWVAGYTNVLTLLTVGHATSHVSGTASQAGLDVAAGDWRAAGFMAALLAVFAAGAALSGFLTEVAHQRRWASIYVVPMAVEAVVLAAFAVGVDWKVLGAIDAGTAELWLSFLPAFAMGLQNATVTRISHGVVRTTHVTGVLTDLGMEAAVWAARRRGRVAPVADRGAFATGWRLLLLFTILGSFAFGAGLGTVALRVAPQWAMVPAVVFLGWIVLVDLWRPIADTQSDRDFGGSLHLALPPAVAVFHIAPRRGRFGRRSRFPDLTAWAERLDAAVRVVVLDLGAVEAIGDDAVDALAPLARVLSASGRRLVLAGVSPAKYRALVAAGVLTGDDPSAACPDLELAAAHAMSLLEEAPAAR